MPSLGYFGLDFSNTMRRRHLCPASAANVGGGITVGLKPGIINIVPVTKKEYKGDRAVGVDHQLPRQDRRLRGGVVHPLLRDAVQVDRRGRRDPVVVRRDEEDLSRIETALRAKICPKRRSQF